MSKGKPAQETYTAPAAKPLSGWYCPIDALIVVALSPKCREIDRTEGNCFKLCSFQTRALPNNVLELTA